MTMVFVMVNFNLYIKETQIKSILTYKKGTQIKPIKLLYEIERLIKKLLNKNSVPNDH